MKIRYTTNSRNLPVTHTSSTTSKISQKRKQPPKGGLHMLRQYIPVDASLDVTNQVSSEYRPGVRDSRHHRRESSTQFRESDQSFDANESITPVKEPRYGEQHSRTRKQESNDKIKTNLLKKYQNKILINQRRISEPADFSPRRPQG